MLATTLAEITPSKLEPNEVHVWRVYLPELTACLEHFSSALSADELDRAAHFRFEKHRRDYILARGLLRQLLSVYVAMPAAKLEFRYGANGKPELKEGQRLTFNLSHSEALLLIAVSSERQLGIDVERVRCEFDLATLARQFFSPSEIAAILAAPSAIRAQLFYTCWTCKEAYVKGTGKGLSLPTDSFDVSLDLDKPAALLQTRLDPEDARRWTISRLEVGSHYKGALAVRGKQSQVVMRDWVA